ncbi:hypothetical protein LX32DRAFT_376884 [Colletotrichum zoysiae]|uniref:Uncharacterized protein n=1 Tax=Colletotrichum zoysiae TaxID=1216348 RepID=A0AAD9HHV6_9PEZI|nr:hypothetical protein LX32DRAFT_376884 [Colletotrichum zoysiae]
MQRSCKMLRTSNSEGAQLLLRGEAFWNLFPFYRCFHSVRYRGVAGTKTFATFAFPVPRSPESNACLGLRTKRMNCHSPERNRIKSSGTFTNMSRRTIQPQDLARWHACMASTKWQEGGTWRRKVVSGDEGRFSPAVSDITCHGYVLLPDTCEFRWGTAPALSLGRKSSRGEGVSSCLSAGTHTKTWIDISSDPHGVLSLII